MKRYGFLFLIVAATMCHAQTIQEKRLRLRGGEESATRAVPSSVDELNREIQARQEELRFLFDQAELLYEMDGDEKDYSELLSQVKQVRSEIALLQEEWRKLSSEGEGDEAYALWHQPWSSIEQLVMDYGSTDYVYIVPAEVGSMRLSVMSNIPVPRQSWDEMLELILTQNGIGIKQLNPMLRYLYLVHVNPPDICTVTSDKEQLLLLPKEERVCFVLSPTPSMAGETFNFLQRFVQPYETTVKRIGAQLFVMSTAGRVLELLKLVDFVEQESAQRDYQMISLTKMTGREMELLLRLYFRDESGGGQDSPMLKVMAMEGQPHSLFLAGPGELVREAKQVISDVEGEIADPKQMTVYTYQVQHSDTEEVAKVLSQVYGLMLSNPLSEGIPILDYPIDPDRPIDPAPVTTAPALPQQGKSDAAGNFVVSPKTGTIIMVVRQDLLPRLQTLLKRIDLPKKMVRIDVLLCEKRVTDQGKLGLDLLRLGSNATGKESAALSYDGGSAGGEPGIVSFLLNRIKKGAVPGFDLVYNFLMGREDIRINANPSVTTVNNTEAKIELVEEISIDNGAYIDKDRKDNALKRSYTRTQYGITIGITPTINCSDAQDAPDYITLDTSVLFDTPRPSSDNRPPVIRRRITNEVRVPNGQTVVLGGLRSRMGEDTQSGLPFLSEIPGFGKLFGSTHLTDRDTEMFIFITPTIIDDPSDELRRLEFELLCHRPGDTPEFMRRLDEAKACEKHYLFERTFKTLFN